MEVGRVYLDHILGVPGCSDGVHMLQATQPVGLSVVGVSSKYSYGFVGGIGLRKINPIID